MSVVSTVCGSLVGGVGGVGVVPAAVRPPVEGVVFRPVRLWKTVRLRR